MALSSVQKGDKKKKPSKLENFAVATGILESLASGASSVANLAGGKTVEEVGSGLKKSAKAAANPFSILKEKKGR